MIARRCLASGSTTRRPAAARPPRRLHNIDTGDGIVQNGPQSTANKLRTLPLWGTRVRPRKMHDGQSLTFTDAILRHGGEATTVINQFRNLTNTQRNQIVTFLGTL